MVINDKYIEVNVFFRKPTYIPLSNVYKIGIENHPYQVAKNYILYVYTSNQIYHLPTHLFNKKRVRCVFVKALSRKRNRILFKLVE